MLGPGSRGVPFFGSVGVRTAPTLFHCQQRGLEWALPRQNRIRSSQPQTLCDAKPPRRKATTFCSQARFCGRNLPATLPTTARYLRLMRPFLFEFVAESQRRRRRRKEEEREKEKPKKMIGNSISNKLVDDRPLPSFSPHIPAVAEPSGRPSKSQEAHGLTLVETKEFHCACGKSPAAPPRPLMIWSPRIVRWSCFRLSIRPEHRLLRPQQPISHKSRFFRALDHPRRLPVPNSPVLEYSVLLAPQCVQGEKPLLIGGFLIGKKLDYPTHSAAKNYASTFEKHSSRETITTNLHH
ncbi:uncharacterized protein B0H64DRAFT_54469 [Chaetomium fimeti]|uniref:Uncharacterized protein n=1 Tax=Chaetomium fimeti TaxID=1854472 RepID=A0AAE0H691_9PEZI|nr:hypothetical protein B0H64DRAFT_54469 [Chaetomium fimeti]